MTNSLLIVLAFLLVVKPLCFCEVGTGVGVGPGSLSESDKKQEIIKTDSFVKELSFKTSVDIKKLENMRGLGYGRSEMISVILISKKSGRGLDEIVKMRSLLMPLREISDRFNLSYNSIKSETKVIKSEIDALIYSDEYQKKLMESASEQFNVHLSSSNNKEQK